MYSMQKGKRETEISLTWEKGRRMESNQKFGGPWTQEKLNIFNDYLVAYLTALKNQKFKKVYIDAFAGTGVIETSDGSQHLAGSAKRALAAEQSFDKYFFIEKDQKKVDELLRMVEENFPNRKALVDIRCGDANEKLEEVIKEVNWTFSRGLLFLDPFSTQVNWTTLQRVASTHSIDVWYLFPFEALNRMLPKNGKYEQHQKIIDRILGDTGWRTEFYKIDLQIDMFDYLSEQNGGSAEEHYIKNVNTDTMKEYIVKRLKTVFPCVSKHPRIFCNTRNAPMFLFCFAISNKKKVAQNLALKLADYILKQNNRRG